MNRRTFLKAVVAVTAAPTRVCEKMAAAEPPLFVTAPYQPLYTTPTLLDEIDLAHWRKKLFAGMGIPAKYFGVGRG
jgi:hypothetical protein